MNLVLTPSHSTFAPGYLDRGERILIMAEFHVVARDELKPVLDRLTQLAWPLSLVDVVNVITDLG